jgi:RNA polymerase sigma-32 factor
MLKDALDVLDGRERRIFEARRLSEEPLTLEQLSEEFDVSRERVRQLEVRAFDKVQKAMQKLTRERDRGRAALMAPA